MDAFIGEVRPFAISYAPMGWLLCDGKAYSSEDGAGFSALFSVIGTTYGEEGTNTFNVPDIRGRVLLSSGTLPGGDTYTVGESEGLPEALIYPDNMPAHNHAFNAMITQTTPAVAGTATPAYNTYLSNVFEVPPAIDKRAGMFYSEASPTFPLNAGSTSMSGLYNPHNNLQPYLVINYYICFEGYYPSQSE